MFKKHRFIFIWLSLDALIVLLHLAFGRTTGLFNLDWEHNVPTLYQSFKLLFAGNVALMIIWIERNALKIKDKARSWFLAILATLFVFIGLDELGQLHENTEYYVEEISPEFASFVFNLAESVGYQSSIWLLYFFPLIIASIPFIFYLFHYSLKVYKNRTYLLFSMTSLFFLVLYLEYISTSGLYWDSRYQVLMIAEETAEMLGGTLGAYYIWLIFKETQNKLQAKLN
jgi:hypothetical protein